MKRLMIALVLFAASPVLAQAPADAPAAAPAARYSVQTSTLGQLADNPATHVIFAKYFPQVLSHPQFNEGRDLTLPDAVQYLPDVITPEKMAAMDAELKALPQ
jgi:hypothetical protein